jgi:hypothetical protein
VPALVLCSDIFGPFSGIPRKFADEFVAQLGGVAILPYPFEGTGGLCPEFAAEHNHPRYIGFNMFTLKALKATVWDGKAHLQNFPWETSGNITFHGKIDSVLEIQGNRKVCHDEILL